MSRQKNLQLKNHPYFDLKLFQNPTGLDFPTRKG